MSDDTTTPPIERRLGLVTGDRLCVECGYNLVNQPILREPHYDLVIVRCPECGAVASVQEYPLLGRWAARWGALLATLWLIFLVAAWPGTSGVLLGWSVGAAEEASWPYARVLRRLHREDSEAAAAVGAPTPGSAAAGPTAPAGPAATAPTPIPLPPGVDEQMIEEIQLMQQGQQVIVQSTTTTGRQDFEDWWAQQDPDALFEQAGGWRSAAGWGLVIWIPATIFALLFGWFWSIALLQMRQRWLYVWALLVIGLTALFAIVPMTGWLSRPPTGSSTVARQHIGTVFMYVTVAYTTLPLMIGMTIGRPITRGLVRALLPPRLRGSLAILWTAVGKEVPR
jgi:hypothetical protein